MSKLIKLIWKTLFLLHHFHRCLLIISSSNITEAWAINLLLVLFSSVIKFNENVLNINVTITQQDSVSINNENLINNFQPGLYNIIEQFEDGETEQQLIIKENN